MSLYWTTAYGLRTEKAEVGLPTLKDNDITTIHEAFQVLVVFLIMGPSINDVTYFLRFLTLPSPLSPTLLNRLMD